MEIEAELLGDETPNQNQKSFLLFKGGKGSGEGRKKLEGFLVLDATRGSAPRRITTSVERTIHSKATTRSARAK